MGYHKYLEENQKMDISVISDESRTLHVAWEVIYWSKRYMLSAHFRHKVSGLSDEHKHDKNQHERIEGDDRDMPWSSDGFL